MKAPDDSTLQKLWRKAVREEWGNRCGIAKFDREPCAGVLECHHVVKRSRPHLRHVPTNGILVCQSHHAKADTWAGRRAVEARLGPDKMEWLSMMERKLFKDYLVEIGKTRAEYLCEQKVYLTKLLNGVGREAGEA